jgi:hypothetical protein
MSSLLLVFQNSMHVRLRGCCRCHDNWTGRFQPSSATWNWTPTYDSFISHHGKLRFSHPIFVSSTWTQRVRSLVNSLLFWTTYLLDYNYIVVPLPAGFYVSAYLNGEGVLLFLTLLNIHMCHYTTSNLYKYSIMKPRHSSIIYPSTMDLSSPAILHTSVFMVFVFLSTRYIHLVASSPYKSNSSTRWHNKWIMMLKKGGGKWISSKARLTTTFT